MPIKEKIENDGLLTTTRSGPWVLADGRLKCTLTITTSNAPNRVICRSDPILARTREALDQAAHDKMIALKLKSYPIIIEMIRAGEINQLRLRDYMVMRGAKIIQKGKWAGRAQARCTQWTDKLAPVIGHLDLLAVSEDDLVDALERVYHRKSKKSGYSHLEKEAWIILDDIMRCAADVDGLIDNNPAHDIAKRCRRNYDRRAAQSCTAVAQLVAADGLDR